MTTYAELEVLAEQQDRAISERAAAQAHYEALIASGRFSPPQLVLAQQRLAQARNGELRARQAQQAALATNVGTVDASVPLLLMPVRLETRYETGTGPTARLRIRVFPDDIHHDSHEAALTDREVVAGTAYWEELWRADAKRIDRVNAWKRLVIAVGAVRAEWVASALTPTNEPGNGIPPTFPSPATQAGRWMRAAQARLLPDRWVAHAWRAGARIAIAEGDLIRRPLAVGPDPSVQTAGLIDRGMLWMTDFNEAVRVGMGLVMDLPDRARIDLLTIFGVRGAELRSEGSAAVSALLVGHQFGVGLDLVVQGSPTNNTADEPSAHGAPDPSGSASFVDPHEPPSRPISGDGGDADLVASALGIPLTTLHNIPNAGQRGVSLERDMATVLWPGTWGYYLTQMLRLDEFDLAGEQWRRWVIDTVRAGGPLPVLRIGNQPYGVLPITPLSRWRPLLSSGLVIAETRSAGRDVRSPGTTTIRVLGGIDSRGGWTFQAEQSFAVPTPRDANLVAIAAGDLDDDGTPEIVVAHASAEDAEAGGVRCTIARLQEEALVVTGEMMLGSARGPFPPDAPSGLAIAIGPLSTGRADSSRSTKNVVVAVVQYSQRRVMLHVGTGLTESGNVGDWARSQDISEHFLAGERVLAAALLPNIRGGVDLIVVTSVADSASASPLAWRVAKGLTTWSSPIFLGAAAGGFALVGASIAIADPSGDGSVQALLVQFWNSPDGTTTSNYRVGRNPTDGVFESWTDLYNLGATGVHETLVSAAATWVPWTPFRDRLPGLGNASRGVNLLERLVGHWQSASARVAHVRAGDPQPGRTLLDLLATDAVSTSFDARRFVGPSVLANIRNLVSHPPQPSSQAAFISLLNGLGLLAWAPVSRLASGRYTDNTTPITEPLVAPVGELGEEPVTWLAEMVSKATPAGLHAGWIGPGVPLLARLIRHSLLQAYADAAFALVPVPGARPPPLPEPELVDLVDLTLSDAPANTHTLTSWRHLSEAVYNGIPVAEAIYNLASSANPPPAVQPLVDVFRSLDRLCLVPSREIDRLASVVLDLATHRLDAWITAVATDRLAELRAITPIGLQTGGYGFVFDLEPATSSPSTGYVHAPSMLHAATAAVLRSGFLTHGGEQLAVDLSSTRVRGALAILEAVRQGQSLGAVLGYRFERELYDRGLAQYLEAFRQIAPKDVGVLTPPPDPDTDVGTKASLVTIDGLVLLGMSADGTLPWDKVQTTEPDHREQLGVVLAALRDAADAIADIGIAESVHQSIQRNPVRAAGTLDALARGDVPPPENPEVLQTPRTGTGVTHRLLVVAPDPASPAAAAALGLWTATDAQRARHVRAVAEPRLNAWAALVLGDPSRVRFTVRFLDGAGEPVGEIESTLDKVGLCPLDVLGASSPGVASLAETNLGRRLLRYAATLNPVSPLRTVVEFAQDRSSGKDLLGLTEFLTVAESARNLVMGARAANRGDFSHGRVTPTDVDDTLEARAIAAAGPLESAKDALRAFFSIETAEQRTKLSELFPGILESLNTLGCLLDLPLFCDIAAASAAVDLPNLTSLEDLSDVLELISGFGVAGAAPPPPTTDPGHDRRILSVQSRAVAIALDTRLQKEEAAKDDHLGRLEAIFGDGFRALPLFTTGLPAGVATPLGANEVAIEEWFNGSALVREPAARLQELFLGSEVCGGAAAGWDIIQVPTAPEVPWVALPVPSTTPPTRIPAGVVSIAVSTTDSDWRKSEPVAALAVDAWVEVVPSREENTAVTFHLDAPSACAPQTAILAVHPDPAAGRWTIDIVSDLIRETSLLAAVRSVDPDLMPVMGHVLPALLLAHNVGGDPAGDTISTVT